MAKDAERFNLFVRQAKISHTLVDFGSLKRGAYKEVCYCPYHDDKTASCVIDLKKATFHCSCGAEGLRVGGAINGHEAIERNYH